MKKSLIFLGVIVFLAACSGFEQVDPQIVNSGENLIEKVVFDVLPIKDGDVIETRASAIPNGGVVAFGWEATDTVAIFPESGSQVYFTIDESNVGKSTASFDGGGWALKPNHNYISYYPFVGDIYLKRNKIPVSFTGQKQIGTSSPLNGARYVLATDPATSENGVLRFSYNTLNTIINVNATLPAGTYTKASLTVSDPLFVEEGTYSLDDQTIVGTKYSTTLKIDLEDVTLTRQGTIPIYFMSAPVDLKNKEVTVKIISSDGKKYECVKTPSKTYEAGTRYGLTCDNMQQSNAGNIVFADANIKAALVAAFDKEGDGELSYMEAAAVTSIEGVFGTKKTYTSFDEFQYFTGVTSIPANMFEGWQITSIILPESVSSIGNYAFRDCVKLISISIPDLVNTINQGMFRDCIRLSSISLPESLLKIRSYAFAGCSNLASISIPESVTSIDTGAFENCSGLSGISIPGLVNSIGNGAFSGCNNITSISLPEGLTSIGANTFYNCSSLTFISIPESVASIGEYAFYNCSSLTSISIPLDVYKIGKYTFYGCSNLTRISIPDSVISIGLAAFCGCSNLTSITIPDSVISIDGSAFENCSSLINITLPESVSSIGNDAFLNCSSLTSITLPESLVSIGAHAFQACTGLTSITIPDGVLKINDFTFNACSGLTSITLPESVTSIGGSAFYGCSSLTSITIPESVTSIGGSAFRKCSSLTSISLPESVTSIGSYAFSNCSSLTSITIPESVTSVEEDLFFECFSLTSVSLPLGLTSIGKSAFQKCGSLTSITIPAQVTSIGEYAFDRCDNLAIMTVNAVSPPQAGASMLNSTKISRSSSGVIYVPAGSVTAYKEADQWNIYSDKIYSVESGYVPPVDDGGDD